MVNSIESICRLYNEDFKYYPGFKPVHWTEISTWGLDELECATRDQKNAYFCQPRFFENACYMDNAYSVLYDLQRTGYEIYVVTMGQTANLTGKKIWLDTFLPRAKLIGCDFLNYHSKSHIDMSDGIIIDDEVRYLNSSNAAVKICFGDVYHWNESWDGVRCYNWFDVKRYLDSIEGGDM